MRSDPRDAVQQTSPSFTPTHARRFAEEGFFVIEDAVPAGDLETLRGECGRLVSERDREMDRLGVDVLDLDHRGRRYFLHAYESSPEIRRFLLSDLMAEVARSALGDTVHLLPYARAGTRDVVPHVRDEQTNDMVGYTGDDPGDPVVAGAGSIVGFSSTLLHRSGPNTTDAVRRVYVAQYSSEPLLDEQGARPRHLAEPLLIAQRERTG